MAEEETDTIELSMSEAVETVIKDLTEKEEAEEAVSLFLSTMVHYGIDPQKVVDLLQKEVERVAREAKH